jgi:RNA polymerase sigma-70 factor, ECF subfamily
MSSGTPDDQDRLDMQQLASGHDAALNALMERHRERLFNFLYRELQNEAEAADLAEETFVRIYQKAQSYDPRHRFLTWLYAIAANLVRDRYRWRARHPAVSLDAPVGDSDQDWSSRLPDSSPDPSATLEARERAETVRRAVATLPEDLKTPLILAEYEGLAHAEIGQVLGCSAKAVEMRLYRARKQLKTELASLCGATA